MKEYLRELESLDRDNPNDLIYLRTRPDWEKILDDHIAKVKRLLGQPTTGLRGKGE